MAWLCTIPPQYIPRSWGRDANNESVRSENNEALASNRDDHDRTTLGRRPRTRRAQVRAPAPAPQPPPADSSSMIWFSCAGYVLHPRFSRDSPDAKESPILLSLSLCVSFSLSLSLSLPPTFPPLRYAFPPCPTAFECRLHLLMFSLHVRFPACSVQY